MMQLPQCRQSSTHQFDEMLADVLVDYELVQSLGPVLHSQKLQPCQVKRALAQDAHFKRHSRLPGCCSDIRTV